MSLVDQITEALRLHEVGASRLSDEEYDLLVDRLREEAPDHPLLQQVGPRGKIRHRFPMLSLAKAHSLEEVEKWAKTTRSFVNICATPKLDGVALSVIYTDGVLTRAVTRGDGEYGEDVTHIARAFLRERINIPTGVPGVFEVRGEAILTTSTPVATNRRNVVAGMLGRNEAHDEAHAIVFVAYDSPDAVSVLDVRTYPMLLGRLIYLGFVVPPFSWDPNPVFDVPFDTDGVVFTVAVLADREGLGATRHHPQWSIALKPKDEAVATTLTDVVWQVGRTGALTPVAVVSPVKINNVIVSRATLHNYERITDLGLYVGCTVKMTRRGSVIPHIEGVIGDKVSTTIPRPVSCPACGETTYDLRCPHPPACPGVIAGRLEYFCKTLRIQGVGPEVAKAMVQEGVTDIAMLYLSRAANQPKIARQLPVELPLAFFLQAMGIEGVGVDASQRAADIVGDINDLLSMSLEDLRSFLGQQVGEALFRGVASLWVISALTVITVTNQHAGPGRELGPLAGQSFVFTGELGRWTRSVAQRLVQERGGKTPSGVTKTTTWLVVGAAPGQDKQAKAAKYGVQTLTEEAFAALLGPISAVPRVAVDLTKKDA